MFVVATALRSNTETVWELHSSGDKPPSSTVQYYRGVFGARNRQVRVFTERQWESLSTGERSDDWIVIGTSRFPRYPVRVPA